MKTESLWHRSLRVILERLDLYSSALLRRQGPLYEDGWFRSFREGFPVDAAGQPLPWLTYPAIDFLASRIDSDWRVFEYGCGYGTLWWAARVSEVAGVDHDASWIAAISPRLPATASVRLVPLDPPESYVEAIASAGEPFDVVIVDGRHRPACLLRAERAIVGTGVIILDNSERIEYREAIEQLRACGFRRVDFCGLVPAVCWKSCTSIFYREGNCLDL